MEFRMEKSILKKKSFFILFALIISITFYQIHGVTAERISARATQNVFIVVIDGARYSETFGDPTHQYIPHIWNDLRPLGSINTNFYNKGKPWTRTVTAPGHANILTGTWQAIPNGQHLPDGTENHPTMPTLWEYVRKQWNVPKNQTWIVSFKHGNVIPNVHSVHPEFGEEYGCSFMSLKTEGLRLAHVDSDYDVWNMAKNVMDTYHPRFVLINLSPDLFGHGGWMEKFGGDGVPLSEAHWEVYTGAIMKVDDIVFQLWQKIESDEHYKGKTMLIITNDHGRHSNGVLDEWQGHGHGIDPETEEPECEGCKHIMFLAIGPDIKQNYVTNKYREQIDILPTIGLLMGLEVPFAEGTVMSELLIDPTEPTKPTYETPTNYILAIAVVMVVVGVTIAIMLKVLHRSP